MISDDVQVQHEELCFTTDKSTSPDTPSAFGTDFIMSYGSRTMMDIVRTHKMIPCTVRGSAILQPRQTANKVNLTLKLTLIKAQFAHQGI